MLAIIGLESIETKMIILREKFKLRFKNFTASDNSFMEKIIFWKTNQLNICLKTDLKDHEDAPLTLIEGPFESTNKPTKMILEAFKVQRNAKDSGVIKVSNQAEIWIRDPAKYRKVLHGTTLEDDLMQKILLFLLNKIPGRKSTWLKCKVSMNSEHFVQCNKKLWRETQIACSKSKHASLETIRNASQDGNLIYKLIASALKHTCFGEMKSFVTRIATGIQESAKLCVLADKEEHHVL